MIWQTGAEKGLELIGRHGPRQQKALQKVAAQVLQQALVFYCLDAFHDHLQAAGLGEIDHSTEQLPALFVFGEKAPVDLDDMARQVLKIFEVRISRAEVVEPDLDADGRKFAQALQCIAGGVDGGVFRQFEYQPARGQATLAQGTLDHAEQIGRTKVKR